MLTLSKLPNELIGIIFEKCEDFCAIFLALCNKRFYNLALALRIDLRYRPQYILKHDAIAAEMLMKNQDILHSVTTQEFPTTSKNSCPTKGVCQKCVWSEIIERWCREKNLEMLAQVNTLVLSYDLLFQFPIKLLAGLGRDKINAFADKVLHSQNHVLIRNYFAVCYRLHKRKTFKRQIRKYGIHFYNACIHDDIVNFIVENFVDFQISTFNRCTLINKHEYLKNLHEYEPDFEWSFRDIDDVEKHWDEGYIYGKICGFALFKQIDHILLCLRKPMEDIPFDLKKLIATTHNQEILEAAICMLRTQTALLRNETARKLIYECIMAGKYHNFAMWRALYEGEIALTIPEDTALKNRPPIGVPAELINALYYDCFKTRPFVADNYEAIMMTGFAPDYLATCMANYKALKSLKRFVAEHGLTRKTYIRIMIGFGQANMGVKFSRPFIDYMYEIVMKYGERFDLKYVLKHAIVSHYVEMVDLLLPITEFDDNMAFHIIHNDDWILFRKCRRYSNKWEKYMISYSSRCCFIASQRNSPRGVC